MATTVRIELDLAGINALMRSAEVQADLNARAERIAEAASARTDDHEGFEAVQGRPHPWIARSYVFPTTYEAQRAEATDKVLTKAIDAGRG